MSRRYRRYEMLLPLRFNDGRRVPAELNQLTLNELREHFGAISSDSQTVRGEWTHQGVVYRDDLVRVWVDVPDKKAHRDFFARYIRSLLKRYKQIDIWMTSYVLPVL
jgi:hypothetical protein